MARFALFYECLDSDSVATDEREGYLQADRESQCAYENAHSGRRATADDRESLQGGNSSARSAAKSLVVSEERSPLEIHEQALERER